MVNIKAVLPNISSMQQAAKPSERAKVKSSEAQDRDANGRREDQNDSEQHPPMSDEEAQKALKAIKDLEGIKDNQLIVTIETQGEIKVAYVKDYTGKIIRRIPEQELWYFLKNDVEDKKTGNLIDKAM